jgi:hypothetical protein
MENKNTVLENDRKTDGKRTENMENKENVEENAWKTRKT